MKIGVLTSSRADYGIYLPLLQRIKEDLFFNIEIIAFGTHLSKNHGYTIQEIEKDKYAVVHQIASLLSSDDAVSVATSYALTGIKFADFWSNNLYDLVFCLGDRFEMSAAVQAGIPFGVKFAHIHGGETTLGAIDNIYRHQISLASVLHFTSAEVFSEKLINILDSNINIHNVGSLSLDNFDSFKPIDKITFYNNFNIFKNDYALVTFHPETVSTENNYQYAEIMKNALAAISKNIFVIVTMPNADTLGSVYRKALIALKNENPENILVIENFGKINYFSAMHYAKILIGNTSSGILEAASFGKYVVNVGNRQKGRLQSNNVSNCNFDVSEIISKVTEAINLRPYLGVNVYYQKDVANTIVKVVKDFYENI